jgi:hypothetical protein
LKLGIDAADSACSTDRPVALNAKLLCGRQRRAPAIAGSSRNALLYEGFTDEGAGTMITE